MELAKYKACICEGSAENAIIDTVVERSLASLQENGVIERIGGRRDGRWIVIK